MKLSISNNPDFAEKLMSTFFANDRRVQKGNKYL